MTSEIGVVGWQHVPPDRYGQAHDRSAARVPRSPHRHQRQRRRRPRHEPRVRRRHRLPHHALDGDLRAVRGGARRGRRQRVGQAPVLLRARGRALGPERRPGRGADRGAVHLQRVLQPGDPLRDGVALRHGRQEDRRLRPPGRRAGGLQALAERHGRPRRRLRPAVGRLHDPVRVQPPGGGRPGGDRLPDVCAVADPGDERDGRLLHQPHAQRGPASRARAAARVPRRPRWPDQGPDGRPGAALRRQGAGLPAEGLPRPPPRRLPAERPRGAEVPPRRHGGAGRGRQLRRAGRRDAGLGARGAARPVAPAVGERLGEGHPAAGARADRRQQPRAHRPGPEPARLPGRGGRPPDPLRERRPRPGAPGDGRVLHAHRPHVRPAAHVRLRRRRLRHGRARLDHR